MAAVLAGFAFGACDAGPDPTASVDPFIGTGGHGHVYPGATVPHGMVQLSPDNGRGGWDWVAGYHASDSVVVGFSHTHLSGTGIGDLADILVMPGIVAPGAIPEIAGSWEDRTARPLADRYDSDGERAEPGYYRVRLQRSGIDVELTATTRTGLHRYTFPASPGTGDDPARPAELHPVLLVDLGYAVNWDRPVDTELRLVGDSMLVGTRRSTGWAPDQTVHFAATFSAPIRGLRLAAGDSTGATPLAADAGAARGPITRALLEFDPGTKTLLVRVGLSNTGQSAATENLRAEAAGRGFDEVRAAARGAWRAELDRVRVAGGTPAQRRLFYTSLYRVHLGPVRYDDADGRHPGSAGPNPGAAPTAPGGTPRSAPERYSIFSLWDTFRAEHPLLTLVSPERQPGILHSILALRRELGRLPVWELLGNETNTMTGYHAVPVLADLVLKGYGDGYEDEALEAMIETADQEGRDVGLYRRWGYVPADSARESVTKTLEFAYDDAAIARAARYLARQARSAGAIERADRLAATAGRFAERSRSWTDVFDPGTGFMRGRLSTGGWRTPFDPVHSSHREDTDYTEGTAWQHAWFVPHDPAKLIRKLGGDAAFIARLDALFAQDTAMTGENVSPDISGMIGQYAQGNEPGHHVPWLYVYAGAPWKTHARVRQILDTLYRATRDGLPGNEDYGQMSAWYVFGAMGFYPVDPVGGVYVLGSPIFEEIEIDVAGPSREGDRAERQTFRIVAPGAGELPYVVGARLNGEPWPYTWITHDRITAGGVLELDMAARPDPAYGQAPEYRPPSLGTEWPSSGTADLPGLTEGGTTEPDTAAMARIRAAFLHAWNGYIVHAAGHDALRPISGMPHDWYDASLFMTPVDAYDTMLLMGLDAEAAAAKAMVLEGLSFDVDIDVQVFEVVIRLLGGLLSAYQMDGDDRWLDLAIDLADRLMPAFDSPTGMPYRYVHLRTGATRDPVNNPAEIGTLILEFGTLSRITGDLRYYDAAKEAMRQLWQRRSSLGLVGEGIDVRTGEWESTTSHVGGRIDSWYEYLLKAWLLFGDEDFRAMYEESIAAVNRHVADTRFEGLWYGRVDMNTGERLSTRFGALEAFLPAVLVLGGDTARAIRLQRSVGRMWSLHGIEPEQLDYATMEVVRPGYPLRPEALESAYYLFQITGDEQWREMGLRMFDAIVEQTRVAHGFAHIADVRTLGSPAGAERDDAMESFFLAETLKYAWLLAAPPGTLAFDEVVFNTEAHPLRRFD